MVAAEEEAGAEEGAEEEDFRLECRKLVAKQARHCYPNGIPGLRVYFQWGKTYRWQSFGRDAKSGVR